MKFSISNAKDIFAIGGPIIIFISIVKEMLYYYAFHIHIIDYLELTESLLLFLDDLIQILYALVFFIPYPYILARYFDSAEKFLEMTSKNYFMYAYPIITLGLSSTYLFLIFYRYYGIDLSLCIGYSFVLPFLIGFSLWQRYAELAILKKNPKRAGRTLEEEFSSFKKFLIPSILVLLIFSTILPRVYKDIKNIHAKNPENFFEFVFKSGAVIKSSDDTVYLGKTRNYFFFFVQSQDKSLIMRVDDVSSTQVQKNSLYKRDKKWF